MKVKTKQQGFTLLLIILILGLLGAAALAHNFQPRASQLKLQYAEKQLNLLLNAKNNLMIYTASTPEIYATNTNGVFYASDRVPSPGYLPCPDSNQDGAMNTPCGQGNEIAYGILPKGIASRHFRFNPSELQTIYYVVDSRYVIQNSDFNNPPTQRFAPLNSNHPGDGRITVGNQSNIIAFIYLDKKSPDAFLAPGSDTVFSRPEHFITLSHQEWQNAIRLRVKPQASWLCALPVQQPHWFNACHNSSGQNGICPPLLDGRPENPVGANWRALLC
ncbi:hypothetical protein JX580_08900 [Thiomicrospira microaerophila]|uniref:hypothetical protein n=1 Tax=Thiomicrospira microaerophila TaxID=406020 RepID=UPI00200D3BCA|nr:hypothetical protein [Thiomicrospira microaerophila]UQB41781.1 hypothetical protein JX580_08900 [Thiomicrospira microaerophila]